MSSPHLDLALDAGPEPNQPPPSSMGAPVEDVRTADLVARLRRHYIRPGAVPGGIFLTEVGLNGSFGASSRVDAIHVGFTNASGRLLTGHEVKVSRGDWLHELDQPGKADTWADQCHAWYRVTPRNLVKPEELPHGWGLMVPNPRTTTRMDVVVKAAVVEDRQPSWEIVRSVMAAYETRQRSDFAARVREATQQAHAEVTARLEQAHRAAISREQQEAIDFLEAVRQVLRGGETHVYPAPALVARAMAALHQRENTAREIDRALEQVLDGVQRLVGESSYRTALSDWRDQAQRLGWPA